MKHIRFAVAVFRAEPIIFSLLILLAAIAAFSGSWIGFFAMLAIIVAEGRIVVLKAHVEMLKVIAGGIAAVAAGDLFNE